MKMKRFYVLLVFAFIIIAQCVVNTMDAKMRMREEAWEESVQALEMEQEKLQLDIEEVREQLVRADEQLHSYNLLIWDIRQRLHFDLELELQEESEQ